MSKLLLIFKKFLTDFTSIHVLYYIMPKSLFISHITLFFIDIKE